MTNSVLYRNDEPRQAECKMGGSQCGYRTISAFMVRKQHSETNLWVMDLFGTELDLAGPDLIF